MSFAEEVLACARSAQFVQSESEVQPEAADAQWGLWLVALDAASRTPVYRVDSRLADWAGYAVPPDPTLMKAPFPAFFIDLGTVLEYETIKETGRVDIARSSLRPVGEVCILVSDPRLLLTPIVYTTPGIGDIGFLVIARAPGGPQITMTPAAISSVLSEKGELQAAAPVPGGSWPGGCMVNGAASVAVVPDVSGLTRRIILEYLLTLNGLLKLVNLRSGVEIIRSGPPDRVNRRRIERGDDPILVSRTVRLTPGLRHVYESSSSLASDRDSPRLHWVRGHFKRVQPGIKGGGGGVYWWSAHTAGDPSRGTVKRNVVVGSPVLS